MINDPNETSLCKSVRLNGDRPIAEEALRCCHIVCFEEMRRLIYPLDLNPSSLINRRVYRLHRISTVKTPKMDGRDYFTEMAFNACALIGDPVEYVST